MHITKLNLQEFTNFETFGPARSDHHIVDILVARQNSLRAHFSISNVDYEHGKFTDLLCNFVLDDSVYGTYISMRQVVRQIPRFVTELCTNFFVMYPFNLFEIHRSSPC